MGSKKVKVAGERGSRRPFFLKGTSEHHFFQGVLHEEKKKKRVYYCLHSACHNPVYHFYDYSHHRRGPHVFV